MAGPLDRQCVVGFNAMVFYPALFIMWSFKHASLGVRRGPGGGKVVYLLKFKICMSDGRRGSD
jgi:hypothetical protein